MQSFLCMGAFGGIRNSQSHLERETYADIRFLYMFYRDKDNKSNNSISVSKLGQKNLLEVSNAF